MLDLAARFLTIDHNLAVLVGCVSPLGNWRVDSKLGDESITFSHRCQMCKLASVEHNEQPESLHCAADPWEGVQARETLRWISPQDRLQDLLRREFPDRRLVALDVFGFDSVIYDRSNSRNVVAVGRRGYDYDRESRP
jgi:hypothetical protein